MCKVLLMKNEIILFTDGNINIGVQINPEQETVWLTQKYCLMLSICSSRSLIRYNEPIK